MKELYINWKCLYIEIVRNNSEFHENFWISWSFFKNVTFLFSKQWKYLFVNWFISKKKIFLIDFVMTFLFKQHYDNYINWYEEKN